MEREMGRTREYRSSVPLAFDIDKHIGSSILQCVQYKRNIEEISYRRYDRYVYCSWIIRLYIHSSTDNSSLH